ncbi:LysR family transcriptional regulator [Nocardia puris]|uniref:DNA-binding transcriptional LysR family regulator n=1 Tax=Nocardia puris TaxID=208602 RepID=A0A366DXB2_9NOCA|nr:LysR family transcriptional regulator [Nocardia puris]RBO93924.1 DNA-binding transcriptional LysR family regulator [Nocardia puris]
MLDVRRLRLLRELARRGTIAAVADALAFTPSAVSQQLSALEREAGVSLLERTGRSVTLTPAGHTLVAHADAVLARLEEAEADLADARAGLTGPLRIGAFPSATQTFIPSTLTRLAGDHPGLEPRVTELDPAEVADALRAGTLDVALIHDYDLVPFPTEPGIHTEPLHREAMFLAAAGATPHTTLDTWRDAPWIVATPGTRCHAMTVRACAAAGFTPHVRHYIDDFATVLTFVAQGHGVALIPELSTAGPPPGVHLARLPIARTTIIACRAGAGRHPAVSAFAAAVRAAVDGVRADRR